MGDREDPAVDRFGGRAHCGAVQMGDELVSETDAQHRDVLLDRGGDDRRGDTDVDGVDRGAGAGRDHHIVDVVEQVRALFPPLVPVVGQDHRGDPVHPGEVVDEVPGEGVVVVDEQGADHRVR